MVTLGGNGRFCLDCCLRFDWCFRGLRGLAEQLAYGLGELCALGGPVVDALTLEVDSGGVGAGIVGADNLDGTTVAGAILLNNDNAIVGLLAGANARQTNHQHWVVPLKKSLDVFRVLRLGVLKCREFLHMGVAGGRYSPNSERYNKSRSFIITDSARF